MNRQTLDAMSALELVEIYNALQPDEGLRTWRSCPKKLVNKIMTLPGIHSVKMPGPTMPEDASGSLKAFACALLCTVDYYEDSTWPTSPTNRTSALNPKARSVGLAYAHVLNQTLAQFPDARTSLASLRWYGVQIAAGEVQFQGYVLPGRRQRGTRTTNPRNHRDIIPGEDYLTAAMAAKTLGVGMSVFYSRCHKGQTPEPLKIKGRLFFKKSEIESSGLCSA